MRRSAVLKDVPHQELEHQLGNYLEAGWVITHTHPSADYTEIVPHPNGSMINHRTVMMWTIFLETDISQPTEVPPT